MKIMKCCNCLVLKYNKIMLLLLAKFIYCTEHLLPVTKNVYIINISTKKRNIYFYSDNVR